VYLLHVCNRNKGTQKFTRTARTRLSDLSKQRTQIPIFSRINLGFGEKGGENSKFLSGKKVHFKKGSEREREREIESRLFHRRSDSSTDTTTAFFPLRAQFF